MNLVNLLVQTALIKFPGFPLFGWCCSAREREREINNNLGKNEIKSIRRQHNYHFVCIHSPTTIGSSIMQSRKRVLVCSVNIQLKESRTHIFHVYAVANCQCYFVDAVRFATDLCNRFNSLSARNTHKKRKISTFFVITVSISEAKMRATN